MTKNDARELLTQLYLRLNGYFLSGYIAHAANGNNTEIDVIGVRFPGHSEPEREITTCPSLGIPKDRVDFVVCEVKGGKRPPNFNVNFRTRHASISSTLNRIGAFSADELKAFIPAIQLLLDPTKNKDKSSFPALQAEAGSLRFVLFAPDQVRTRHSSRNTIYGDEMLAYVWRCLRPAEKRKGCAIDYNKTLWGYSLRDLIFYFKDEQRAQVGQMQDLYDYLHCTPH